MSFMIRWHYEAAEKGPITPTKNFFSKAFSLGLESLVGCIDC